MNEKEAERQPDEDELPDPPDDPEAEADGGGLSQGLEQEDARALGDPPLPGQDEEDRIDDDDDRIDENGLGRTDGDAQDPQDDEDLDGPGRPGQEMERRSRRPS